VTGSLSAAAGAAAAGSAVLGATGADWVLWALVLLPAVTGAGLGLVSLSGPAVRDDQPEDERPPAGQRWAPVVTVAVLGAECVLAGVAAAGRPRVSAAFLPFARFGLAVDGLAALILPAVVGIALLVMVFAAADVREARARFCALMLVFVAAVVMTVTATTLPTLLLAWEVMGAASFALIGFAWWQEHRVKAGVTAFVTTRLGDLGLYVAAGAAVAGGAGLDLGDLAAASSGWRHVVAAGILLAALGKAAQLPFSFWLSRAMVGPSPVSALLHSAAMVAMGGYLLLRVQPLLAVTGWAATTAAWCGAATAVLLGVVAVAQRDLKQLLAASTAAQLGFVVLGAGVGAVAGGAAQLVAHAAVKSLLFLAAGAWLSALGTKQLPALQGVARRWPVVGVCAGVAALALGGVVPLSLWATKDEVLAAALATSGWLYATGLLAAVLSAGYAGKVLVLVWRSATRDATDPEDTDPDATGPEAGFDTEQPGTRRIGWLETLPLIVLAVPAALLGVLALPPVRSGVDRLLGQPPAPAPGPVELLVSAVLAVVTVLGVVLLTTRGSGVPEPGWARNWLGLHRLALAGVVDPTDRLARVLARADDKVLARGVERVAALALQTATLLQRVDVDVLDAGVVRVAAGVRRLAGLARRPQTGLLHHYYIQAVAVLAAGAVLLVLVG